MNRMLSCFLQIVWMLGIASRLGICEAMPLFNGPTTLGLNQVKNAYSDGEINMHQNKDPSNSEFLFNKQRPRFRSLDPDSVLLNLEKEYRDRNLLYNPQIQRLIKTATKSGPHNKLWAINKLEQILEAERIMDMRTGDVFRPLAPPQLLSQGNLHLYNQVDGNPWLIPSNALTRGMLLTGPQGGGKTRLLIWIAKQLSGFDPPVPFLILDPKGDFKDWATYLNAIYLDVSEIALDLKPPPGLSYEQWLTALMPQLGDIVGSIYGVEILQKAAVICIAKRNSYMKSTGIPVEISLKDIFVSLSQVDDISGGRRQGYFDAVSTAISRILSGSGNLFNCSTGIDLETLFGHNVILGCRGITDDFALKFLAMHLLYWQYESERFVPSTNELKSALIFDDGSRFLGARGGFDAASKATSFTHIYAVLRSSGRGVIVTTQIPHLADPGIAALSHSIINVGSLHFAEDTKLLVQMMNLTEEQRMALHQLRTQEAIGVCASSAWVRPVHGFTVNVPDPEGVAND
jgi:hypothetical protein